MKALLRYALAIGFLTSGTLHFLKTSAFVRIVPPQLGHEALLVYLSGAFELLGAVGALVPATRRAAGYGLIALLIAVFPANVYMALHPALFADAASPVALALRLPMQLLLIAWVWWCCLL